MNIKSERITILGSPNFKAFLGAEAKKEGVSISELVRRRCQAQPLTEEELILEQLIKTATKATKRASKALDAGLMDAETILTELRADH
jgi:hypothetical protein